MSNCTRHLGLDVHAETITAAIAEGRGKLRGLGKFPNRPEAVRKLVEKLGAARISRSATRPVPRAMPCTVILPRTTAGSTLPEL